MQGESEQADKHTSSAQKLSHAKHKLVHHRTGIQAWHLCTLLASGALPDTSLVAGTDCAQSRQSQEIFPAQGTATSC